MREARARISSKGQTVIPKVIREKLGLRPGDTVRFKLRPKGGVTIDKAPTGDGDPFVTFDEWASEEDEKLFRDL
jgi:antitoxin PrlF